MYQHVSLESTAQLSSSTPPVLENQPASLDFDQVTHFLALLDPEADAFVFSAHDDDKERARTLKAAAAGGATKPSAFESRCAPIRDSYLRRWMTERQAAGWGITVSVQAMGGDRRRAAEVTYIRAVFAEMDIGEPLRPWPIQPSVIVETSPGRYHVYWFVDPQSPVSKEDFQGMMMRMCETYGSDPDAKDLARTLRLPGTWNLKPERLPHLVRVMSDGGARYSGEDLLAAFPPPAKHAPASTDPRPTWDCRTPVGLERFGGDNGPLTAISPDTYGDWLRVGMALHHEAGGNADGLVLWDNWSAGSPKWSPGVCAGKWATFGGRNGITGGTIIAVAKANGWQQPAPVRLHRFSSLSGFSTGARPNGAALRADGETAPDPLPLLRSLPAMGNFPVEALGSLMGPAAQAFQAKTQAPMDICASAVLAVAGLAAQAHADVRLPTGEVKPLSLYLLAIARSGERKTSADVHALTAVKGRETELREGYEVAFLDYRNARDAWEAERKRIVQNKKLNLEARKRALDELGAEPKPPLAPLLICHEPTFEGLAKLLINGQPSIGIFASEGGAFIGGHAFSQDAKLRSAAGLSLLWDDGRLTRVRAEDGFTALAGRRVALHLQAQPDVAARLFSDPVLADQGLLSRILVVAPDSLQGHRYWKETAPEHDAGAQAYVTRVNLVLRRPMPLKEGTRNELTPRALTLTREARRLWIEFSDEVEGKLRPGGRFEPISGFAAKLAEHAARIAGVITMFEQLDAAEIEVGVLTNAIRLCRHYADAALRLHGASRTNADLVDALLLMDWARLKSDRELIALPDVVQTGPNRIRDTARAKKLIEILEQHRHLEKVTGSVLVHGKVRRDVWRVIDSTCG